MLSDWDAPYIQSLVKLIETQSKAIDVPPKKHTSLNVSKG